MKIWKHIAFGILLTAVFTACLKTGEFPNEPYLEYLSFTNDPDEPIMRFKFTDGDGNVGLDNRDTLPPFHPTSNPVNLFHWNFWLNYYERVNGEWVQFDLDPEATFTRIPRLDPEGQNKALEGEVVVNMTGWFPLTCGAESVRYGAILVDRDLNESNEAFSEEIFFPSLKNLVPNSGSFSIGSNINVSWTSSTIDPLDQIVVQFSPNGGTVWKNVSDPLPANQTSFTWQSNSYLNGESVTSTTNGKFRVTANSICNPQIVSSQFISLQ